ncbi:hypothetical protein MFIFM68171_09440 [Madurella fahalii]|uniref:Uncharacterized protein n=1 Tax=Madurella fahalii TaxID=1157608 RepID=A0ABQ0GNR3_9PEZI
MTTSTASAQEHASHWDETDHLLPRSKRLVTARDPVVIPASHVHRALPLALSVSLAMAATAATEVYAYAVIICADPTHCREYEQLSYAGAVALATGIANVCGTLALGPLQGVMKTNPKAGLLAWIVCRATNVAILCVAVICKSVPLALTGRIFEGLATDNLLHFILNTIYLSASTSTSTPDAQPMRVSRLMGTSVALYMTGMALSPTIAGILPTFFASFLLALSLFAASALYLCLFMPVVSGDSSDTKAPTSTPPHVITERTSPYNERLQGGTASLSRLVWHILSLYRPWADLRRERGIVLPAFALLFYNTTQAYIFPALMVFTTLELSFTGRQNGYLISIAAAVSALHLLFVFYGVPRLKKLLFSDQSRHVRRLSGGDACEPESTYQASSSTHDFICALLSMSAFVAVLPCVGLTSERWQVFLLVALLAPGFAAPSFLKSYGASLAVDKTAGLASMAMMESLGGLLSALVLGSWQSYAGEGSVFFGASSLSFIALLATIGSRLISQRPPPLSGAQQ